MSSFPVRQALACALVVACSGSASADPTKDACIDAHSRGQDARDAGKLSLARKLFLTCAQSTCPNLVQADCARFANDLDGQQPTISLVARDSNGVDLPDTTVYVDDALLVTRLDDGRPHDADPGKHVIRFSNGGRDQTVTIVLSTGEKNRTVEVRFPALGPATAPAQDKPAVVVPSVVAPASHAVHPLGAKVMMVGGGVVAIGGLALGYVGLSRVPSSCSVSTHECMATPGDPALSTATSSIKLANVGWVIGGAGAAVVLGGMIWYFAGASTESDRGGVAAIPWIAPSGGGIAISGRL